MTKGRERNGRASARATRARPAGARPAACSGSDLADALVSPTLFRARELAPSRTAWAAWTAAPHLQRHVREDLRLGWPSLWLIDNSPLEPEDRAGDATVAGWLSMAAGLRDARRRRRVRKALHEERARSEPLPRANIGWARRRSDGPRHLIDLRAEKAGRPRAGNAGSEDEPSRSRRLMGRARRTMHDELVESRTRAASSLPRRRR